MNQYGNEFNKTPPRISNKIQGEGISNYQQPNEIDELGIGYQPSSINGGGSYRTNNRTSITNQPVGISNNSNKFNQGGSNNFTISDNSNPNKGQIRPAVSVIDN